MPYKMNFTNKIHWQNAGILSSFICIKWINFLHRTVLVTYPNCKFLSKSLLQKLIYITENWYMPDQLSSGYIQKQLNSYQPFLLTHTRVQYYVYYLYLPGTGTPLYTLPLQNHINTHFYTNLFCGWLKHKLKQINLLNFKELWSLIVK